VITTDFPTAEFWRNYGMVMTDFPTSESLERAFDRIEAPMAERPDDDVFRFPPDPKSLTGVCLHGDHHMCGGRILSALCGCETRCQCKCHKL